MKTILVDIVDYLVELGIECRVAGDPMCSVNGYSSVDNYVSGTLTWIKDRKRVEKAGILSFMSNYIAIVQEGQDISVQNGIYTNESKRAFFDAIERFFVVKSNKPPIGPGCYISESVTIGENVTIGANCILDGNISIGSGTVIEPGVIIINRVSLGDNCYVQAGVCIGIDGYGYSEDEDHRKTMIKHYGGVKIGNQVFIGSHTNIARGTIDNTIICDGVKIAPSTHIGHNNKICENASIVCSTMYGSVTTGKNAYVSASIVRNQITLGDNCVVGMGSLVTKDVAPDITVIGSPAKPIERSIK